MTLYGLVQLDLSTGERSETPWRFDRREEALAKVLELSQTEPDRAYIVKVVPAA